MNYAELHDQLSGIEKEVLAMASDHADITDRNERGALGLSARRAARACALLAETFDLLSNPPIDG